jgi:hypothetical protein
MSDISPKYRCAECRRGVLNRAAPHCLYCGAALPSSVRLGEADTNERKAGDERRKQIGKLHPSAPEARDASSVDPIVEGIEFALNLPDLL